MTAPDDALLAELGRLLRRRGGPPPEVVASAKDLFGLRDLNAELAALTYDSLVDDQPASVRSGSAALRTLTFDASGLTIELEIDEAARRLIGQLVPADAGELTVAAGGVTVTPEIDGFGRFTVPLPTASTRLALHVVRAEGVVSAAIVV